MISRRSFIGTVAFGIFFLPLTAAAQPASKRVVRIGYLGVTPRPTDESFRQGLRELGYVEGQNIAIEYRWGGGSASDHDALARELVRLKVDVIVAVASPSTRAAKQATGTIPVVMVDVGDPVAFGFVPSLARPGGNVTGLSAALTESYPKGLQLLKEVIPNLARVGSFDEPTHPAVAAGWNRVIDLAVQTLGVTLQRYNVLEPADLKRAFAAMKLFVNLGQVLLAKAGTDPEPARTAFELFRRAFELKPTEETLPARLLMAGMAGGREREAWEILGSIDLSKNLHLRPVPFSEALPIVRERNEQAEFLGKLYKAGLLPFEAAMKLNSRPAWFVWLARINHFRRSWESGGIPQEAIMVDLPTVGRALGKWKFPPGGVLLDPTAILTLGSMNICREIIEAFKVAQCQLWLFPGCIEWLGAEIQKLRSDQLPGYRNRFGAVKELLERGRRMVDIREAPAGQERLITEVAQERLGLRRFDVEHAVASGALYLDDYLDDEELAVLDERLLLLSSELLARLNADGLVPADEAAQVRREHPQPFGVTSAPRRVDPIQEVVVSETALLAWYDAGLLARWLGGEQGWPRIIVGPWAWARLTSDATEASLYQTALQRAEATRASLQEAIRLGIVKQADDPGKIEEDLRGLEVAWEPTLKLFRTAKSLRAAIWADDLFVRLITDRRGLLPEDREFRQLENKVHLLVGELVVFSAEGALECLKERGAIAESRLGELVALLFGSGYRVLTLRAALRWWLSQNAYDPAQVAIPYLRLFRDLERTENYLPDDAGKDRRRLFAQATVLAIATTLISEIWAFPDPGFRSSARRDLADTLVRVFERVNEQ